MPYLLDTNICIYLIKNRPVHVIEEFQKHSLREMAVSIITVFELEYGAEKSQFKQRSENALANFLLPIRLIELDYSSAKEAATIRARLEKKGKPIGPYDLLIAGTARSKNMTLVTNNTKEFERIEGLQIENWVTAAR